MDQTIEEQFEEYLINKYGVGSKEISEVSKVIFDTELERFMSERRAYNEEWKDD